MNAQLSFGSSFEVIYFNGPDRGAYPEKVLVMSPNGDGPPLAAIGKAANSDGTPLTAFVQGYAHSLLQALAKIHEKQVCHLDVTNENFHFNLQNLEGKLHNMCRSEIMETKITGSFESKWHAITAETGSKAVKWVPAAEIHNGTANFQTGTPGFMSPERLSWQDFDDAHEVASHIGEHPMGTVYAMDIWSAAITIIHAAAGVYPLGTPRSDWQDGSVKTFADALNVAKASKQDNDLAHASAAGQGKGWIQKYLEEKHNITLPIELTSHHFFEMIDKMLHFDWAIRCTALDALESRFFSPIC